VVRGIIGVVNVSRIRPDIMLQPIKYDVKQRQEVKLTFDRAPLNYKSLVALQTSEKICRFMQGLSAMLYRASGECRRLNL
jgi:hypothetical protein